MGLWRGIKNVLYKLDFFYTAELLRYREEPEYRTLFGGFLSFSIILMLLVTFYNKVIDTFEKVLISSSLSAINADDPTPYNISTMPGKPFMFGVQIWHHDLNANPRYFDVVMKSVYYESGQAIQNKSVTVPLQPCTKEHWSEYPKIQQSYDRLNINYWLCLPKNAEFEIYGKYASVTSKTLEVSVSRCTNSTDFTHPCAPDAAIDQFFQDEQTFFYTIYFINPLLNADSQEYLSHYLQDSNYVIFSATDGEECQLWMQDYTITTDESIIPFTADKIETGGIVSKNCIKNRYSIDPSDPQALYSTMIFFKSPISKSIGRSFQKIDEILSYIGGLFGTIAICLFLINIYNSYSFEITMGGYLFKPNSQNMQKHLKKYNFFYFILHMFYSVISVFNCKCDWPTSKLFYECREEMVKQLDILFLYKRVVILERAIGTLLNEKQIQALHLYENPTLAEAKKYRRRYKLSHDSFIYRAVVKNRQMLESQEAIQDKKIETRRSKQAEIDQNVPIVTIDGMNDKNGRSIFMSSLNTNEPNNKPEFINEHQQSSDSQEEEEGESSTNTTDQMIKDLAMLRAETDTNRTSKAIWERLGHKIQAIVYNAQQIYDQSLIRHDNNLFEAMQDDNTGPTLNRIERKPKVKRFKQLPTIAMPKEIKVGQWVEEEQIQSNNRGNEGSIDHFIEMQEFVNPIKKTN